MLGQVQAGLLKAIEERRFTPVGASTPRSVDVRFLSATNADIEAQSASGGFRADLLERLREGGTILIPPLRDRLEDLPELVNDIVRDAERRHTGALRREVDPEVFETLAAYHWPGNVRQLRNCLLAAVNTHPDIEYLSPIHITIPNAGGRAWPTLQSEGAGLDSVIAALSKFSFPLVPEGRLSGQLPRLQAAYGRLVAGYLAAAIRACRRPPGVPGGSGDGRRVGIQPALKLMTGDPKLTASQAADWVKRLLALSPGSVEDLLQDPDLAAAHALAERLRPRRRRPDRK